MRCSYFRVPSSEFRVFLPSRDLNFCRRSSAKLRAFPPNPIRPGVAVSSVPQRIHPSTSLFTILHRLIDAVALLAALGLVCRFAPSEQGLPKTLSGAAP